MRITGGINIAVWIFYCCRRHGGYLWIYLSLSADATVIYGFIYRCRRARRIRTDSLPAARLWIPIGLLTVKPELALRAQTAGFTTLASPGILRDVPLIRSSHTETAAPASAQKRKI
jgi:hypothetical protein